MVDKIAKNINEYTAHTEPANSDRSTIIRRITIGYKVFERTLYPAVIPFFVVCTEPSNKKSRLSRAGKGISNQLNKFIKTSKEILVKSFLLIKLPIINLTYYKVG